MAKYFKNVTSFKNLKEQFKKLALANHPDAGGKLETMQEINVEFDALFSIWKNRKETTEEERKETASETRRNFYTQNGWEGSRYDRNLSTKEISKTIRTYIKEKYPTWKFSVTTGGGTWSSSIDITLVTAPSDIFNREYLTRPIDNRPGANSTQEGYRSPYLDIEKMEKENKVYIQVYRLNSRQKEQYLNDLVYAVLKDVQDFAQSYNFDDSDSMIDYFSTNFYLSINIGSWQRGFEVVEKTARIKESKNEVKTRDSKTKESKESLKIENDFTVTESKHTKTNDIIWLVKYNKTLDKMEYIELNKKIKEIGGYYSKFTHSFVFSENPEEKLVGLC